MGRVQADFGSTSQLTADEPARLFWGQRQTKFRLFAPFLSTSEVARDLFGGSGRQNSGISHETIAAARHCKNKFRSRELCIL